MSTLAQVENPRGGSGEAEIRSDPCATGVHFASKTGDTIVQKAHDIRRV